MSSFTFRKPSRIRSTNHVVERGPKTPQLRGRSKLPAHLPRVPVVYPVTGSARICPHCNVEAKRVGAKVTEKLELRPASYLVERGERETVACQKCNAYVRAAPKSEARP